MGAQEAEYQRSVEWLPRLYAIVVGLALTDGIKAAFDASKNLPADGDALHKFFNVATWPAVTLLVTLVPFFHGSNRYWDDVHYHQKIECHRFVLLVDFWFLFAEGLMFYWLALVIKGPPSHFYAVYSLLLLLDLIWASAVGTYTQDTDEHSGGWSLVKWWVLVNVLALAAVGLVIHTPLLELNVRIIAAGLISVARSAFDYALNNKLYFPERARGSVVRPERSANRA